MTWFLASLPTLLLILVVVGFSVGLSIVGLLLARSKVHYSVLAEHNDIAGFVFATVGVTYAVVLALVANAVWDDLQAAGGLARDEAAITLNILREAEAFPEAARRGIQTSVRDYVKAVAEDEWPLMATGRSSARAEQAADSLWASVLRVEPGTPRESTWHYQMIESLRDLSRVRGQRLAWARDEVPWVMWGVLLVGAAVTVAYTYLYGVRRQGVQIATTSALAALIGLVLSLIVALDHPFTGDASVKPEALHAVLDEMERTRVP